MFYTNKKDKKIFYEVINQDSKSDVIVFLNGVMASTSSWVFQMNMFKDRGYKIILHDFLGQLKSDKFEGVYSFNQHALDLHDLLHYLDVKNVHLIGTSYGGEVAMKYASLFPENVKSMSVIDSVSDLDDHLIQSVQEWIELAKTYNGELFFNGMMPSIYGETYQKNNSEFLEKRAKAMNLIPKDYFDGQVGLYRTFIEDVYMTDVLSLITCPSLIICGEKDTLKPPKFSKLIADNIKNSAYVILPDCGHVSIFEKPNELNTCLLGHIVMNEK